mmetsp:Transcript_4266/g.6029  ORF Transcript_4266/g.6029 Transcript_4266/m.6029 type:complete len:404 (+) Transcript_4266:86-1297(+)
MTDFVKWDKVAREVVADVIAEADKEIKENDAALGLDRAPLSAAEADDQIAHQELKEVRKKWNEREAAEQAIKLVVTRIDEEATVELRPEDFTDGKRVAALYGCMRTKIRLTPALSEVLIKLFIEDCEDLEVLLDCSLTTSFVDVSRCKRVNIIVNQKLHTIQCDLSENIIISWASANLFDAAQPEGPRIYHAGCKKLCINAGANRSITNDDDCTDKEQQFLTHLIDNTLITEKIIVSGDSGRLLGATQRDLDQEQTRLERQASRQAEQNQVQIERNKGNDAFSKREYTQAILHYTLALDASTETAAKDKAVLLANRAACWLKLGHPDKALTDATQAVDLDPDYPKAYFRKGLALHALQRYKDALPVLGTAQKLEPKNKQVAEAIRFAEMRLARGQNLKNPYAH